jgi:hypothetical protein
MSSLLPEAAEDKKEVEFIQRIKLHDFNSFTFARDWVASCFLCLASVF